MGDFMQVEGYIVDNDSTVVNPHPLTVTTTTAVVFVNLGRIPS